MGVFSEMRGLLGGLFGRREQPAQVDFPLELVQHPADISTVGIDGYEDLVAAARDVEARGEDSPYFDTLREAAHDGLAFDVPIVMGFDDYPPEDRILRVQVVGFQHDVIQRDGSKAAVTCLARHAMPVAYAMNEERTNEGGWQTSRLRRFHTRFLMGLFPKSLRQAIRPVRKATAVGMVAKGKPDMVFTTDSLWLPSASELLGTSLKGSGAAWARSDWARSGLAAEGEQLPYFRQLGVSWSSWDKGSQQAAAALAGRNLTNGGALPLDTAEGELLWLRSSCLANDHSFLCIDSHGRVCEGLADTKLSLCVGFAV